MKKERSLVFKIMASVNLLTLILMIAFSFFLEKTGVDQLETSTHDQFENLGKTLSVSTTSYFVNGDKSSLESIIDSVSKDVAIEEISFISFPSKKEIARRANLNSFSYHPFSKKFDVINVITKEKVGEIFIRFNFNRVFDFKSHLTIMTIALIVGVQLIITLILYLILKLTNRKLSNEFRRLRNIADSNFTSSQDSSSISKEVSLSATEQATALQETVSTLHEITEMVNNSVNNANKSSEISTCSYEKAKDGQIVVKEMMTSMQEITESNSSIMDEIHQSNNRIKEIVTVINEISAKTNVINDIVFQTKLLSFNASVEAARAGEHGKGFAVVAEEVGNLAQMSGNAAKEISSLLEQSINKVNQIIEETNSGIEKVVKFGESKIGQGIKTTEKCNQVLNEIVDLTVVVRNTMNEISQASKEQAFGIQNISQAMNQVDKMVNANENSANRSFQTSQKLLEQSNELKETIQTIEAALFGAEKKNKIEHKVTLKEKPANKESIKENHLKLVPSSKTEVKKTSPAPLETKKNVNKSHDQKIEKKIEKKIEIKNQNKEAKIAVTSVVADNKNNSSPIPIADDSRFEDI